MYTEEIDKANVLNMFFKSQTILNDDCVVLPDIQTAQVDTELDRIILTPQEVQSVIEILPLGKASGPNGLNNRILRELSSQVSAPYRSLFNQSLRLGLFPKSCKEANVCPVPKKEIYPKLPNTDLSLCSILKVNYLRDLSLNICLITYKVTIYLLHYSQGLFPATPQ